MAELSLTGALTLVELAKRTHNGKVLDIANVLEEYNEIFLDAVFQEANSTTAHIHNRALSLPAGAWRLINRGVPAESGQSHQISEGLGMLESISNIDEALIEMSGSKLAFRQGEDNLFLEGMSQSFADAWIYGNVSIDPEEINGLATRYNAFALPNVESAGGDGSTTSVWILQWGWDKCFFVYPKGHPTAGLGSEDQGRRYVSDGTNEFLAWTTHFKQKAGFVVRDDRCVQRICNIEPAGVANIFDPDILVRRLNNMKQRGKGAVIYANETVLSQMDIDAMDKANVLYQPSGPYGDDVTHFRRRPIRLVAQITDAETALAA